MAVLFLCAIFKCAKFTSPIVKQQFTKGECGISASKNGNTTRKIAYENLE